MVKAATAVQVFVCPRCQRTYASPIPLTTPPSCTNHIGGRAVAMKEKP